MRERSKRCSLSAVMVILVACTVSAAGVKLRAQAIHEAPADATSTGRLTPQGEPGTPLNVSGVVVGVDGKPLAGVSI